MKLSIITVAALVALAPAALAAQSAGASGAGQVSGQASTRAAAQGSGTAGAGQVSGQAGSRAGAQGSGTTGAALTGGVQLRGSVSADASQPAAASTTAQGQDGSQQQGGADGRIRATLAAAAAAHLPTQLLESKVAEGRAKHVPEDRIASAVEARYQALLQASTALRNAGIRAAGAGDLAVAADALQAGVSQSALIKLERSAPAGQREVATATLAQLVQLGYGSDAALLRVDGALAQGEEALANLRAEAAASLRVRGGLGVKIP